MNWLHDGFRLFQSLCPAAAGHSLSLILSLSRAQAMLSRPHSRCSSWLLPNAAVYLLDCCKMFVPGLVRNCNRLPITLEDRMHFSPYWAYGRLGWDWKEVDMKRFIAYYVIQSWMPPNFKTHSGATGLLGGHINIAVSLGKVNKLNILLKTQIWITCVYQRPGYIKTLQV